ncbi:MAG: recombinase family protein [Patescibacteria group bacterium]|nr:recombinase family protein [Patescibacteria group bacterium]
MNDQVLQRVLERTKAANPTAAAVPIKYCLYARKSTEQEEKQILSIDSQIKEMLQIAEREGLNIVETKRESHSAKASGGRETFNEIVSEIRSGKFNAILTWAPDRLSRNAGDLGSLVDLMDQKLLLEIRTYGQKFTNSPSEKFLLMILCSQAKLENDNKSVNVKRGLRARVEMGMWPGQAPTGYLNENRSDRKGSLIIDPKRAPIIKKMFERVAYQHSSGRELYFWLKDKIKFTTKNGKHLALGNIYRILRRTMYYGVHEWPEKSGQWYTGKFTPIITQELFQKVQEQLNKEGHPYNIKEFAFIKLITCGHCGSGITAQDKLKQLKDGTTARYIYYGCTRARDLKCKGGYLREEELIAQLINLIDQMDVNGLSVRHQIDQEFERYNKFQGMLGGEKVDVKNPPAIDPKSYAKYLLKSGSAIEKRELLSSLKSKLILENKIVVLGK